MNIIKTKKQLCTCCMEEHEVKTVIVSEHTVFKGEKLRYDAEYMYCDLAEELYMTEEQIQYNDIQMKDAYRKKQGLLTSSQIVAIRAKYSISQSDLCLLLGWGGKTITRYESHQIQDKAHDMILKKLNVDPEWFISLLYDARGNLSEDSFRKYHESASFQYEKYRDLYLRKAIEARRIRYTKNRFLQAESNLAFQK
ncbi:type II toxin-antitoxin system MqsA family antitoxin [Oribacterium sp. P6A1]|uniref:type II toxin-antitoxin system MqsA family antitoxin n=1 Tax=Oribacterium sp. P6A1 TaxID=1410612 RepID=UPI000691EDAC|nr:type II toxin-antitoxin system MqsA family antitoxin [Oribacterium sp. P6A1]